MSINSLERVQHIKPMEAVSQNINSERQLSSKKIAAKNDNEEVNAGSSKEGISYEKLRESVNAVNKTLEAIDKKYEFSIHEETDRPVVKVYDRNTGEIIKQIPPEEVLNILTKIRELIGIFIDERV
ncbi:MAG: flagellar protein FlaG [Thermosediminibacterales bacterium]|jgi:flagellar protein FlaG|nr:flagellar protein FlaG [Thermosediminibacterales bacterium]